MTDTSVAYKELPLCFEQFCISPASSTSLPRAHSSTFQLLSLLISPLLARVACHLQPVTLLRLQRCSSALHRLRNDGAFMSVA